MSEFEQRVIVGVVERIAVIEKLDDHIVGAEKIDEVIEFSRGIAAGEPLPHGAFAAPGKHDPVTVRLVCEFFEIVEGPALFASTQLGFRDGRREPVIALLLPGEHQ